MGVLKRRTFRIVLKFQGGGGGQCHPCPYGDAATGRQCPLPARGAEPACGATTHDGRGSSLLTTTPLLPDVWVTFDLRFLQT